MSPTNKHKCAIGSCPNLGITKTNKKLVCHSHDRQWRRNRKFENLNAFIVNKGKLCGVPTCPRDAEYRGLCNCHYQIVTSITVAAYDERSCTFPECKIKHYAKDLCRTHYYMYRTVSRYGNVEFGKAREK